MDFKDQPATRGSAVLNVLAIAGPSICIVHCLAMPMLVALLPVLGLRGMLGGINEQLITLAVLPLCALAIVPGFLKHGRKRVVVMMLAGMACVLFGSFAADHVIQLGAETPVVVLGSLLLAAAGLLNIRLTACKQECAFHSHHSHNSLPD